MSRWILIVVLVVLIYLYLEVPAFTKLIAPVVGSVWDAGYRMIDQSKWDRARVVARIVADEAPDLPFGAVMAIAENESQFRADALNPSKSGAAGVFQIVRAYWSDYGVNESNVFDVTANTRAAIRSLRRAWATVQERCAHLDYIDQATLLYYAHGEGRGALLQALNMAQAAGGITVAAVFAAVPPRNRASGFIEAGTKAPGWDEARDQLLCG